MSTAAPLIVTYGDECSYGPVLYVTNTGYGVRLEIDTDDGCASIALNDIDAQRLLDFLTRRLLPRAAND